MLYRLGRSRSRSRRACERDTAVERTRCGFIELQNRASSMGEDGGCAPFAQGSRGQDCGHPRANFDPTTVRRGGEVLLRDKGPGGPYHWFRCYRIRGLAHQASGAARSAWVGAVGVGIDSTSIAPSDKFGCLVHEETAELDGCTSRSGICRQRAPRGGQAGVCHGGKAISILHQGAEWHRVRETALPSAHECGSVTKDSRPMQLPLEASMGSRCALESKKDEQRELAMTHGRNVPLASERGYMKKPGARAPGT